MFVYLYPSKLLQSWHNQLKTVYLKQKNIHCLDMLINLLADNVPFDITEEVSYLSMNIGRMSTTEKCFYKNEIKAENEQESQYPSLITYISDSEYSVVSFNNNAHNTSYIVLYYGKFAE